MKINAEIINPYFPRVPLGRGLPLPHTPSPEPNLRAPAHLTPPSGSPKGSQKVFKKVLMERIKKVAQTWCQNRQNIKITMTSPSSIPPKRAYKINTHVSHRTIQYPGLSTSYLETHSKTRSKNNCLLDDVWCQWAKNDTDMLKIESRESFEARGGSERPPDTSRDHVSFSVDWFWVFHNAFIF